jgi:hypothetical protein
MSGAIFVKKTVIGKFEPGPIHPESSWELLRHHLAATLFSRKKVQAVTDLVGRHYELVSVLYRMLGAKVGKRVFWPGHQPVFTGQFDLLEIGDDVVFGSRSLLICTTVDSCKKITLCAGSNVADNCVVMAGAVVGKNAVMGSNTLCPEDWYLPESSVWLGSKGSQPTCLERGTEVYADRPPSATEIDRSSLQFTGDASTLRPFGKAIYKRDAKYFVWPVSWIVFGTLCIRIFIAVFHTLPLLGAIHGAANLLFGWKEAERDYHGTTFDFATLYHAMLKSFIVLNVLYVGSWLAIELSAKWAIMGMRQVGRYNYDLCDYAQRWELYQMIAKIRKFSRYTFLQFFFGTPYMSAYFRWNGGDIGKDCCLYPSGADPFMPEPDLVQMGDRCVVDCASIVCHLNTRGNFELIKIIMEDECTLRTRSRIQQGVYMEHGSQLLEKSLALTGEVIEADSVWQGGPASFWFAYDKAVKTVPYGSTDVSFETSDETTRLLSSRSSSASYSSP